jgi:hypothetical protein
MRLQEIPDTDAAAQRAIAVLSRWGNNALQKHEPI